MDELAVKVIEAALRLTIVLGKRGNLSRRQRTRQIVCSKLLSRFQRVDMLENCAEKLNSLLHAHAQSIRRRLNSYDFAAWLSCNLNIIAKFGIRSALNCLGNCRFLRLTKEYDSKWAG
jgi:hypothetical protein